MRFLSSLSPDVRQYLVVTGNYWAFSLTDGALRMLVVLHFYDLGYSPLQIALLFLFYEIFGVVTNLLGGWLGAYLGLNKTMNIGLGLQVCALAMLLVPTAALTVPWVMTAQAVSGIAKDLNKMSAKSALKLLVHDNAGGGLYTWVALLTGSKNTLKGAGFFLGGALLAWVGFQGAVAAMAATLALVWLASLGLLTRDLGKASAKPKFSQIFSKSTAVNYLSAARMCLFCARDIWFVVALPVYLTSVLGWDHWQVGGFLALWVIGYGAVQATSPRITRGLPDGRTVFWWAVALAIIPATIALLLDSAGHTFLLGGLLIFGGFFAVNSSLHSYLILSYASADSVSLDVGFYYMANAMGRLLGTVLSGWTYQVYGLPCCLWISAGLVTAAAILSLRLPRHT
jgi:hypothetical protein